MKEDTYKNIVEIDELPAIDSKAYEQIFNMYKVDDVYYAHNILKTLEIPDDIDDAYFYYVRVAGKQTWVRISSEVYGTQNLWWLILLTNKIMNPVLLPEPGTLLRILKPDVVTTVLNKIQR